MNIGNEKNRELNLDELDMVTGGLVIDNSESIISRIFSDSEDNNITDPKSRVLNTSKNSRPSIVKA